jgi:hypothetical protein
MQSPNSEAELRATLAARRADLCLSQAAAGAACSPAISQQTISEMESGAADTGIETLARYAAQALGRRLRLASL